MLQHGFKLSFKRGDPVKSLSVALIKNIILEFAKCFNMDSSFPSRGVILRPHDISDMIMGFFCCLFFATSNI